MAEASTPMSIDADVQAFSYEEYRTMQKILLSFKAFSAKKMGAEQQESNKLENSREDRSLPELTGILSQIVGTPLMSFMMLSMRTASSPVAATNGSCGW
eukprot:1783449-Amphidinium_carterae.1